MLPAFKPIRQKLSPVKPDAILNFLWQGKDSPGRNCWNHYEVKQETWLVEHGQPRHWRGLAANQLKSLIAFTGEFPTQLAS